MTRRTPSILGRFGAALTVLLISAAGCEESVLPMAPEPKPPPPPGPSVEASVVYRHLKYPNNAYVLSDDGSFVLRYGLYGEYHGRYTRADTVITFDFAAISGWCREAWCQTTLATARAKGDSLLVRYGEATAWLLCTDMMDFEACDRKEVLFLRSRSAR